MIEEKEINVKDVVLKNKPAKFSWFAFFSFLVVFLYS